MPAVARTALCHGSTPRVKPRSLRDITIGLVDGVTARRVARFRQHNLRNYLSVPVPLSNGWEPRIGMFTVNILGLCAGVQLGLAFGLAALLWPNAFMPLFDILMFPWTSSCRLIRANGAAAIGLALLVLVMRLTGYR
jgi:hypothetical protein